MSGTALRCGCVLFTPVEFCRFSLDICFYRWPLLARIFAISNYIDLRRYAVRRRIVNSVFEATFITDCRSSIFSSRGVLTFQLTLTCMECLIATAAIGVAF